jgi:sigma-E factor negative regulatory protein RseB
MQSKAHWCALLLLSTTLTARAADVSANIWLDRFAHSMKELNYRGVLSYERGDHLESLRVTHGIVDGEPFERLEHLDGAHREVIRRGKQLHCVQLGQHLDLLLHNHVLKPGLAGLDPYYDLQTAGDGRVAGRRCIDIAIKPRDEYRIGYRLALDRDTGLLLRSEALDANGQILERLQFVDVEISRNFKPEWLNGTDRAAPLAADAHTIDRVIEEVQMPWRPRWLPPGFVLALAPHRPSEEVLTYSDGLAVLSIFVTPAQADMPAGAGRASQGATVAVTKQIISTGGAPFSITVIGEVPLATAQLVADSVSWSDTP